MVLSKSAWYMKAYFFIESWWAFSRNLRWTGKEYTEGKINNADICTFMRAFIMKLPFLIFLHLFTYWLLFFTFIQFPMEHLGLTGYFTAMIIIAGLIGLCAGLYLGKETVCNYFTTRPPKPTRTTPSFLQLVCTWIKARHDKVCVLITFTDEETKNAESN